MQYKVVLDSQVIYSLYSQVIYSLYSQVIYSLYSQVAGHSSQHNITQHGMLPQTQLVKRN